MPHTPHHLDRQGLTLVELLVVITILVIVAGVVLPMAQPALKGRAVREASRQLQVYLTAAQNKAFANQEYVGVRIERVDLDDQRTAQPPRINHVDDVAYRLTEVKLPTPNKWLPTSIVAMPTPNITSDNRWRDLVGNFSAQPPPPYTSWEDVFDRALILLGSSAQLYRINARLVPPAPPIGYPPGTAYRVHLESLNDPCITDPTAPTGMLYPPAVPLPVKIFVGFAAPRFSFAPSVELPVGTYIDLSWSGTADLKIDKSLVPPRRREGKFWDDGGPVTLLFGPDGNLQLVAASMDTGISSGQYRLLTPSAAPPDVCSPFRPQSDVYLLISNQKKRQERALANFDQVSGSFWVIISPATGLVTTAANLGVAAPEATQAKLHEMRSLASKAIAAGG